MGPYGMPPPFPAMYYGQPRAPGLPAGSHAVMPPGPVARGPRRAEHAVRHAHAPGQGPGQRGRAVGRPGRRPRAGAPEHALQPEHGPAPAPSPAALAGERWVGPVAPPRSFPRRRRAQRSLLGEALYPLKALSSRRPARRSPHAPRDDSRRCFTPSRTRARPGEGAGGAAVLGGGGGGQLDLRLTEAPSVAVEGESRWRAPRFPRRLNT